MQTFMPGQSRSERRASFDPIKRNTVAGSGAAATTRPGHDFSRIAVRAEAPAEIQAKRTVNVPGDAYEREAELIAGRVMDMTGPALPSAREEMMPGDGVPTGLSLQRAEKDGSREAGSNPGVPPGVSRGGGNPLPDEVRAFMEPRFGFDFSQVRVHTDLDARRMSRSLNAQAFTHQQHVYFGPGKSPGKDALTAHELTHVLQQTGGCRPAAGKDAAGSLRGQAARVPSIQRVLEVRPPGRGEASAFDRRQELIDRLNAQSTAIQYRLDGRRIEYDIIDEAALTHFDRQMRDFIDRAEVVPMRLITSAGRVMGSGGRYQPLLADSFIAAYVDLDDLLADDDYSFQSDLIHFLTERFQVRGYERLIGTDFSAQFDRAHRAGKRAEAALLQDVLNDPSIYWVYEETKANGTWVSGFKSRDEGYWVFQVVSRSGRPIAGGKMHVKTTDGRRLTIEEFRAERGISTPAAAPAAAPAVP